MWSHFRLSFHSNESHWISYFSAFSQKSNCFRLLSKIVKKISYTISVVLPVEYDYYIITNDLIGIAFTITMVGYSTRARLIDAAE